MIFTSISELPPHGPGRVKRNHSSIPISRRISPHFRLSRLNRPFWSNQQNDKVGRLMQFLQGNFPRNLNMVRQQNIIVQRKQSPENSPALQGSTTTAPVIQGSITTTPAPQPSTTTTIPSTEIPIFKLPTTLIPIFALSITAFPRLKFLANKEPTKTVQTTSNQLPAVRPVNSVGMNGIQRIDSSKNATKLHRDVPTQHVDTSLVSPSGSLILRVFNNYLVFHKAQRKTTTQPPLSITDSIAKPTDNKVTRTDTTTIISTAATSAETTSTLKPTRTIVTPSVVDGPKPFVNIVRNVGEVFCKICATFGHQWKEYCEKKNCMIPPKPVSL